MPNNKKTSSKKHYSTKIVPYLTSKKVEIGQVIRFIADQDKAIKFDELNKLYKQMAKTRSKDSKHMRNISVVVKHGDGHYSTLKAFSSDNHDLRFSDDDYYNQIGYVREDESIPDIVYAEIRIKKL
jgi:hypothetical protein